MKRKSLMPDSAKIADEMVRRVFQEVFGNLRVKKVFTDREGRAFAPEQLSADETFTAAAICRILAVSRSTLHGWQRRGCPLAVSGRGRPSRFDLLAIARWLETEWPTGRWATSQGKNRVRVRRHKSA